MILADKIVQLRKKQGWSQEELAEKMNISRQSISKWESAVSIPDINKILDMAEIFGVSTDYLLKDEIELIEYTEPHSGTILTLDQTTRFIENRRQKGRRIGLGTLLCILSPGPLILLAGLTESTRISESLAAGLGLSLLVLIAAAAVALFILSGMNSDPVETVLSGDFELAYGVDGILRERWNVFSKIYARNLIIGVLLLILSVLPLILTAVIGAPDLVILAMVCLLLVIAAAAVYLIISAVTVKNAYDQLLDEGDFTAANLQYGKHTDRFSGFFWPVVTAAYLLWSFISRDWHITWLIWPVASLLFAGIAAAIKKD